MKPSINKATQELIKPGMVEEEIVSYVSSNDEFDRIIFETSLRIRHVLLDRDIDLMLIILSNAKILKRKLSEFEVLYKANVDQLNSFVNDGTGVYWENLDYDLSLHGFLEYELTFIDKPFSV